jgi:hypothetical protein
MRLPSKETLDYAQTLTVVVVGGAVGAYLLVRAVRNPGVLARAARKATGS